MNDTRCTFECVNLITVHRFTRVSFLRQKGDYYAKKSISKNGVRIFITVVITVHAYVFYSLYVIHGNMFMQITGESGVLAAINKMGGVPVFGKTVPIWAVVLIEFVLAYTLENLLGSPLSFKLASKNFDPRTTHPVLFESAIICATVGIMCPVMSFIAAFLYYNYQAGFNMWTLLADRLKLVCFNFPFAFFTQLFFIQPLVRNHIQNSFYKGYQKPQKSRRKRENSQLIFKKTVHRQKELPHFIRETALCGYFHKNQAQ